MMTILALVFFLPAGSAEDKTWTGSSNQLWENSNNWNPTGVPDFGDDVYIPNVATDPVVYLEGAKASRVQINSSASLTIDGGTLWSPNMQVMSGGTFDLSNNDTVFTVGTFTSAGTVDIGSDYDPIIYVYFNLFNSGTFNAGNSEIIFNGSGDRSISSGGEEFNRIVINNSGLTLKPTSASGLTCAELDVQNGELDMNGYMVRAGKLDVYDTILFDDPNDVLNATGEVDFYNGASVTGSTGTFKLHTEGGGQNLVNQFQSLMQFTGDHLTHVTGPSYIRVYDFNTSSYFNDFITESSSYSGAYERMVVNGRLTVRERWFLSYYSGDLTAYDVSVEDGGEFKVSRGGHANITHQLWVDDGGSVDIGESSWRGWLEIGDNFNVDGDVVFEAGSGSINVSNDVRINSTGNITFNEGGCLNGTPASWFGFWGDMWIDSDKTVVKGQFFHFFGGDIWVNGTRAPEINITDNFEDFSGGSSYFRAGKSTVVFSGTADANIDTAFSFNSVIIMKTAQPVIIVGTGALDIQGSMLVVDGTFDLDGHEVDVWRGDWARYDGEVYLGFYCLAGHVIMDDPADFLDVTGNVYWGDGSTAEITTGLIEYGQEWTFDEGSAVNLTGDNQVVCVAGTHIETNMVYSESPDSSFHDLEFDYYNSGFTINFKFSGSYPVGIDGNLTVDLFNENLWVGSDTVNVWGDLIIERGDIYHRNSGIMNVHGNMNIMDNPQDIGGIFFGYNDTMGGGEFNVDGYGVVDGEMYFYGYGTNASIGKRLSVNSSNSLMFNGFSGNLTAGSLWINQSGVVEIYSNDTIIDTGHLIYYGLLKIGNDAGPTIKVSGNFNMNTPGEFRAGRSRVEFTGTGIQTVEDSYHYWGLVVNKPSGSLSPEGDYNIDGYLAIEQGAFDVADLTVTIPYASGDHGYDDYPYSPYGLIVGAQGELVMTDPAGVIDSENMIQWASGSQATVTAGNIYCGHSWYWGLNTDIQFSGTNMVEFDNIGFTYLFTYSNLASFNDLTVSKSQSLRLVGGSSYSVQVRGDMVIDNTDSDDAVNMTTAGRLEVDGNLRVLRGALEINGGRNVTVHGDLRTLASNALVTMFDGELSVDGVVHAGGWGINIESFGGEMWVGDTLYVASNNPGFDIDMNDAGSFDMTVLNHIRTNSSMLFRVLSDDVRIHALGEMYTYGTLQVGTENTPEFKVGDDFQFTGTFICGQSTVILEGDGVSQYADDGTYWNLVVNKTSGVFQILNDGVYVQSCFFIVQGTVNLNSYTTTVNSSGNSYHYDGNDYVGFVNYGGNVRLTSSLGELIVNGPVIWGPNSTGEITDGTIWCNGTWDFQEGSDINLTGLNVVRFFGSNTDLGNYAYVLTDSASSSFQNVSNERDATYGIFLLGNEPMTIDGNYDQNNSANVQNWATTMEVWGEYDQENGGYVHYAGIAFKPAELIVHGPMTIQASASFLAFENGETNNASIQCEQLEIYGSLSTTHGIYLHSGSDVSIWGTLNIGNSRTAEILVDEKTLVFSGGTIEFDGTGPLWFNSSSDYLYVFSGGEVELTNNKTNITVESVYNYGLISCGPDYEPTINVRTYWYGDGVYRAGLSTIGFIGDSSNSGIYVDQGYYDIYIDKGPSKNFYQFTDLTIHDLNISSGQFSLNNFNLTSNGTIGVHGKLTMPTNTTLTADDVYWYSGATESISDGTFVCTGDLIIYDGTTVTLSGTSLLEFDGSQGTWNNHDDGTSFNNVLLTRTSWTYLSGTTERIVIDGYLRINAPSTGGGLSAFNAHIDVADDLTVYQGKLLIAGTDGNISVSGQVRCADGSFILVNGDLIASSLKVDGKMNLNTTAMVWISGSAYVPGSKISFNSNGAFMHVGGDLEINNTGIVNMNGTAGCTLNIDGELWVRSGGAFYMANDNAELYVRDILYIASSGVFDCGVSYEPDIYVWSGFDGAPSQYFTPGHSIIHLEGENIVVLENDYDYWGVVVNKTAGYAQIEAGPGIPTFDSFFFIEQGLFRMNSASMVVNSNGSGYYHDTTWYKGFANYAGELQMTDQANVLDVNGDVFWGNGSTEQVTSGTIHVDDDWTDEQGATVTLSGDNQVIFDGADFLDIRINDAGNYFRNVIIRKNAGTDDTFILGSQPFNVTGILEIWPDNVVDPRSNSIEARTIFVFDNASLNMTLGSGELYVWDDMFTNSSAFFTVGNSALAVLDNLTAYGEVNLGTGANLTILRGLYVYGDTLDPGLSTVYFTGSAPSACDVVGSFNDLFIDKDGQFVLSQHTTVNGDLMVWDGSIYPNSYNVTLAGDWWLWSDAWLSDGTSWWLIFLGDRQFVNTGGAGNSFDDVWVTNGAVVDIQNDSAVIDGNLTIDNGSTFQFSAPGGSLTTGADGVSNSGDFKIQPTNDQGCDVMFQTGTTFRNYNVMSISGNPGGKVRLLSTSKGSPWSLIDSSSSTAQPFTSNVRVMDSNAAGGNTIYAGGTSVTDGGSNSNWVFVNTFQITISGNDGREMRATSVRFGENQTADLTTTTIMAVDEGSDASVEDEKTVLADEERYYTEDTASWTVNNNISVSVAYYHQYKPDITLGGTTPSRTVTAYYTALGGQSTQTGRHTDWTKWVDSDSSLSFSKNATGPGYYHTNEDFSASPWDPLSSALTRTVTYAGNNLSELKNGDMNPAGGNTTIRFNFTVDYLDADNDAPDWVYVEIDGTNYTMEQTYPADTDYTDGAEFFYETNLAGGCHTYKFYSFDGYEVAETAEGDTGEIIPEFGLLMIMIIVALTGISMIGRRRR